MMKNRSRLPAVLLSIAAIAGCLGIHSRGHAQATTNSAGAVNQYDPSYSWLAWQLFLQVMAPTNGSLSFETWTEQCQLTSGIVGCPEQASMAAGVRTADNAKVRMLHGSVLAKKIAGSDCSAMMTSSVGGYAPPSNLAPKAVFCEEIYVSPPEASFVKMGLTTLAGQEAYGKTHNGVINFPGTGVNLVRMALDSLEVKVDWAPASSFKNPGFECPDPTGGLYTETINGTCYALVGVHITSKATPNWLWATFEPNSNITNPNRCDPKLYGACSDPWGTTSSEPYGKGQTAKQSPLLHRAMSAAHLNPAFEKYFLTGVQTKFVTDEGRPTQLGNSFVEFNTGVPPGKSSCITCHRYAYFDGKQPLPATPENGFGRPPHGWPAVGYACNQSQNANCTPAARNSTSQDFSWMLGLMPYRSAEAKAASQPQSTVKR
jgi:hypothetical protein